MEMFSRMVRKSGMHIRPMLTHPLDHWILFSLIFCILMHTRSLGGALYFVTFIDDATRKVSVYVSKGKDDVYPTFRKFLDSGELQKGHTT